VLPTAMPTAAHSGMAVVAFAMSAPSATPGQSRVPKRINAASEMPVGAHTGVAFPCATGTDRPSFAVRR
jgi:hypothetical protein